MSLSNSINNLYQKYPVAAICVGLSVLVLGAYGYRFTELDSREQTLADLKIETDGLQKNVSNATELESHLKQLKDGITKLEGRSLKELALATNLQYFLRLEEQTGVKVVVTQGSESAKARAARKTTFFPISFSVAADATWPQLLGVLRALETGPIEYRPTGMRVLATEGSATPPKVSLDLSLDLLGLP